MSSKPYDPKHPVSHIEHQQEKRASIPTTERQGEESAIVDGEPQQSEYDIFRHEFRRGNDPELYWLNKYRNDNEDTQHPSLKTDIRSLYVHEDINPEQLINRLYRVRDEKAVGFENQTELSSKRCSVSRTKRTNWSVWQAIISTTRTGRIVSSWATPYW